MTTTLRLPSALLAVLLVLPAALPAQVAQEAVDLEVVERIRDEGLNRSQIEELGGYLTDVIGPRLTGSTGMMRANQWTADRLRGWGVDNVRVEAWGEFGRGWERVHYSGRFLEPFAQPLTAQPVAWTGSTNGPLVGEPIIVRGETVEELERFRGRLGNAIVLYQEPPVVGPEFDPRPLRLSADALLPRPPGPTPAPAAQRQPTPDEQARANAEFQRQQEVRAALGRLLREEGVGAVLTPSPWAYGLLRVHGGATRAPGAAIPPPELIVSLEHYGQIWRNLERGVPVRLELDVQTRFLEDDLLGYNTLGDIPGSDLAHEYVMIGAHLDSWHSGTGATDNAAGSIVMMEAMRILRAIGAQPRRTIRIALWSGEEQGLLGSRAWVENNQDSWDRISAYLNLDNGTGRIRGIWNQSNAAATPIFEQVLFPFRDLGVVAVRDGNTGGTDHLAFDRVGIPGFNFVQDPIEYGTRTHHSNVDTFERLMIDDLKQAAVIVAATAYHLAMRDELVPRKPAP